MSDKETSVFGLEEFSPVERIVLTANGNLQRILSAYFGAPITVKINECHRLNTGEEIPRIEDGKSPAIYRREVELLLHGKVSFICNYYKVEIYHNKHFLLLSFSFLLLLLISIDCLHGAWQGESELSGDKRLLLTTMLPM